MNHKSHGYLFPFDFSVYLNGAALPVVPLTALVFQAQALTARLPGQPAEGRPRGNTFQMVNGCFASLRSFLLGMQRKGVDKASCYSIPPPRTIGALLWFPPRLVFGWPYCFCLHFADSCKPISRTVSFTTEIQRSDCVHLVEMREEMQQSPSDHEELMTLQRCCQGQERGQKHASCNGEG